ncbi:MAG: protoporphyrinogen oxidase HemJ [Alphaproteobacteria bacterium]
MQDVMQSPDLALALHIIAFTTWMSGMFYLPRLYAYHAAVPAGSEMDKQFQLMERRLLRIIVNPAMVATLVFGGLLAHITGYDRPGTGHWLPVKLFLVLTLVTMHGFMARWRKSFVRGENTRSPRFYKIFNEIITVLFMAIVFLVVFKPF